jgi:hypothetical protein
VSAPLSADVDAATHAALLRRALELRRITGLSRADAYRAAYGELAHEGIADPADIAVNARWFATVYGGFDVSDLGDRVDVSPPGRTVARSREARSKRGSRKRGGGSRDNPRRSGDDDDDLAQPARGGA